MTTICKDCGVRGRGVHHCEEYSEVAHLTAELDRVEREYDDKCDALQARVEALTTAFHIACGTISTMDEWSDKHPQDVVDEYLRLATEPPHDH